MEQTNSNQDNKPFNVIGLKKKYNVGDKIRIKSYNPYTRTWDENIDENTWYTVIGDMGDFLDLTTGEEGERLQKIYTKVLEVKDTDEKIFDYDNEHDDLNADFNNYLATKSNESAKKYKFPSLPKLSDPEDYYNAIGKKLNIRLQLCAFSQYDILNEYVKYYLRDIFAKSNGFNIDPSFTGFSAGPVITVMYISLEQYITKNQEKYIPDIDEYREYLELVKEQKEKQYNNKEDKQ